MIDRRGGTEALKEDLNEVKDAATSRGSMSEKAKAAAEAVKTPGRNPPPAGGEQRSPGEPRADRPSTP
ncbi:MAG TPA: hypothetical protein VGM91_15215 [Conexibacter sp.]|jgi:hypothetical protein